MATAPRYAFSPSAPLPTDQNGASMPTTDPPTTLDFLAVWTDTHGNQYEQPISLTPVESWRNQTADELSAHLAWVCEHHAIASYSITSI